MIDDAIHSLRMLFFASLLVLVLWLLSWPASSEKLRLYSAAAELHAWLYLKEKLATLEKTPFETEPDQIIANDIKWVQRIAPNEESYPIEESITVDVTWPERRSHSISLVPAGLIDQKAFTSSARVYRIVSDGKPFPWSDAYAIFLSETETVIQGEEVVEQEKKIVGIVAMDAAAFKASRPSIRHALAGLRDGNRPKRWEELRLPLAKHGFVGGPEKLSSRDAALAGLRAEADPRVPSGGVHIFGIQLSVAQFFSAVGILLAAISFAMVGPLLVLRSSFARKHSQSWVFVLPLSAGKARRLLEWTICAATILWAVSPMLVLLLQVRSYALVDGAIGWAFGPGAVGLVVAGIIQGMVARELRATRRTGSFQSDGSG